MTTPEQAKTKIDDAIAIMNASRACLDALKGLTPDQCRQVLQFLSTLGLASPSVSPQVPVQPPQFPAQPEQERSKWPFHPNQVVAYGAPGLDSSYTHVAIDPADLEIDPADPKFQSTSNGIFDNGGIFGGGER